MRKIKQRIQNFKRFRNIVTILARHGFGFIFEKIEIKIPFTREKKGIKKLSLPERSRLALEELGTTFIKLGQILATRPDIIPAEFIAEFEKLQTAVPAFSGKLAERQIRAEFRKSPKKIFRKFEPTAIASASIAQVHRAKLLTGKKVAIKIQRPGIRKTIETDLEILYFLAERIAKRPEASSFDPVGIVREFDRSIRRELDFVTEGHNLDSFNLNFADSPEISFPKVFWKFATPSVLAMEFVEGTRAGDIAKLKRQKKDLKLIAERGADAFFKQVFLDGFFHADPHGGNIFVQKNENIVFLDCGMVGHLDREMMVNVSNILTAFLDKDAEKIVRVFAEMEILNEDVELGNLRRDVGEFVEKYYNLPLKDIRVGAVLNEMVEVVARHRVRVPANLFLLAKAIVTLEGVGRQLDPDFNAVDRIRPFMQKVLLRRLAPRKILSSLTEVSEEWEKFLLAFPRELNSLVKKINHDKIKIEFGHSGLENLTGELRHSSNLLSFSFLISALVVSSSLVVHTELGAKIFGISLIGFIGYTIAAFLALIWLVAIIRKRKR